MSENAFKTITEKMILRLKECWSSVEMFKLESYITPILLSYVEKYVKNVRVDQSQVGNNRKNSKPFLPY